MANTERILVTGGSGFLGRHIVSLARAQGHDVVAGQRVADRSGTIRLDVRDEGSIDAALRAVSPDLIINCAAYGVNYADQDFDAALAVNVLGALSLLEAAARFGAQRFVHVGSCFEYGSKPGPIREDAVLAPTATYGATKAAATLLLGERARALGIELLVVRPFGMWGPGEPGHRVVPQLIAACRSRTPLDLTSCEVIRDYTYVEDMAAYVLAVASVRDLRGVSIVNLGSGRGVVLRDFIVAMARLLNGEALLRFGALPHRPTEMQSLVADVSLMRRLVGTLPMTSLGTGVQRMISHASSVIEGGRAT